MTRPTNALGAPLRIADLAPLHRVLGSDLVVVALDENGVRTSVRQLPALFLRPLIHTALSSDAAVRFDKACGLAVKTLRPTTFRPAEDCHDEILITPVLDNSSDQCRYLVCWERTIGLATSSTSLAWDDLRLTQIEVRYRLRVKAGAVSLEVSPWWVPKDGEVLELWPHHTHVSAMGLGHAVTEELIMNAAEAAAEYDGGPAVRISIPSADILGGLIPVFHGALCGSGLAPERLIVAIDVELAADPDLLPIIVHLRTMGMKIDIVGLDVLTATLHSVSDTSDYTHLIAATPQVELGPWCTSIPEAIAAGVPLPEPRTA